MKKQSVIIGIVIVLVSVALSGCNEVDQSLNLEEQKFIGTWVTDDENAREDLGERIIFRLDRTVTFRADFAGTFEVDAGNYLIVHITQDGNKTQHLFDYGFSDDLNSVRILYQNTGRLYLYRKE
jgi:hypothetical protein